MCAPMCTLHCALERAVILQTASRDWSWEVPGPAVCSDTRDSSWDSSVPAWRPKSPGAAGVKSLREGRETGGEAQLGGRTRPRLPPLVLFKSQWADEHPHCFTEATHLGADLTWRHPQTPPDIMFHLGTPWPVTLTHNADHHGQQRPAGHPGPVSWERLPLWAGGEASTWLGARGGRGLPCARPGPESPRAGLVADGHTRASLAAQRGLALRLSLRGTSGGLLSFPVGSGAVKCEGVHGPWQACSHHLLSACGAATSLPSTVLRGL